jgi:hypothetical protein
MEEPQEQPQVQSSGQRIVIHHTRPAWTREERAGFAFVIAAGFLALVLGIFFMLHHVSAPFYVDYTGPHFKTDAEKQAEMVLAQKEKDTDGDTLSDYDELYVYKTSPYLSDTDGDNVDDAIELRAATNPNCPAGADCSNTLVNPDGVSGNTISNSIGTSTIPSAGSGTTGTVTPSEADIQAALSSMTPAEVRTLLLQAGATQAQIDGLTDEQVMALYQSALADAQGQQSTSGTTSTTPSTTTP